MLRQDVACSGAPQSSQILRSAYTKPAAQSPGDARTCVSAYQWGELIRKNKLGSEKTPPLLEPFYGFAWSRRAGARRLVSFPLVCAQNGVPGLRLYLPRISAPRSPRARRARAASPSASGRGSQDSARITKMLLLDKTRNEELP